MPRIKKLKNVMYPKDFINPRTAVSGDEDITKLIDLIHNEGRDCVGTGDALVMLTELCYVEVYKLVAQCEVEWEPRMDNP